MADQTQGPTQGPAQVHQIPKPWMRGDFVVTDEAMVMAWLADLRTNGEIDFRYSGNSWYQYKNGIWREDEGGAAVDRLVAAFQRRVGEDVKKKDRTKVEIIKMHNAILRRAACELYMKADDFDADDLHIANIDFISNGHTPDGDTFAQLPHAKEHYISKCCSVAPINMPTPKWDAFLKRVQPDPDVREFLYRAFGYCLTGLTIEQCFLFLFGVGQNGKGTFIDTMRAIFGSYAAKASINLLIRQKFQQHPEELAQLRGIRLVVANETDKGVAFDEAKLKQMSSDEPIRARLMRQNSFELRLRATFVVVGNHRPNLTDTNKAMHRRILLVPFNVIIPDDEKNKRLKDDLIAEYPGILYKLLLGLRDYQDIGLAPPEVITNATDDYVQEEDAVGLWVEDADIKGQANDFTSSNKLYQSWCAWAVDHGEPKGSEKALTQALKAKDYCEYDKGKRPRGFWGLRID